MSADLSPGVLLPRDIFPVIFRHLSQAGLCTCLRVCKAFYHMITSDEVVLARLQIVHSFRQFSSYLEVGKHYYHAEYYTDIGQNDNAKFPFCEEFVVTELSQRDKPEMHLSYASVTSACTGSMLFAEKYVMGDYNIYGVSKFDVMLRLLENLWKYVTDPDKAGLLTSMPFMNRNMRKAIKKLKRHMRENPRFGEFAMLQAGQTEWYAKVMGLRPEEEPECSSDEEWSQEVPAEDTGKVPVFFCKRCQWKVGGFTCQKGACGKLLVLQDDSTLRCPKGCGVMDAPLCCRRLAMKAQVDPCYIVRASSLQSSDISWEACPVFSCKKCGFGVGGIRCFTCSLSGQEVKRNGFFERVWCAYVWTCPTGCGRRNRGGLTHSGFISCKCQGEEKTPLEEHGYLAKFGPPQN